MKPLALRLTLAVITALSLGRFPAAEAQQVDTVRAGSASLAGAALEPGGYLLENYMQQDGVDQLMSTTSQVVRRDRVGSTDVWIIETEHMSSDTSRTIIVVRADDFSLMHHRVVATQDSTASSSTGYHLTGWVALADQPVSLLDVPLNGPVFPVEGQIPWLFPLLPLADGYAAAIVHFSEWSGQEKWNRIRVVGSETIDIGGRSFDCWKIDGGELFPGYGVTYWVEQQTRRVVRGVARGQGDGPVYWSQVR